MTKDTREATPHHTMARAAAPMDMIPIDITTSFPWSLGGSRFVMFVDSDSHLQRPYKVRDSSTSVYLGVVKRVVAFMGVPLLVWTENGAECTSSMFEDICNGLGILRKLGAPYTPQKDDPVESGL